eukprot:CAMPEP_0119492182 /NCGR_PEP_ID=MMETSP1344-20130328/16815_1 /TAXON_ID=236787 /ORGANISM="Florenciella parvula, Strain CCMP2471" /LENGTH=47 /DNA_ID= /DNA_START= /DNA_END= /DNA_ORIENTATION=
MSVGTNALMKTPWNPASVAAAQNSCGPTRFGTPTSTFVSIFFKRSDM